MYIKRMLLLASMALAAAAFTAPAAAQAQTHGLTETNSFLTAGSLVTVTSSNLTTTTGLGQMTCGLVTLHYHVVTNNDEHLVLEPTPAETVNGTATNCVLHTSGGGTHNVDITSAGTDTVTVDTWGRATVASKFTATITFSGGGSITCTYAGNVSMQATNGTSNIAIGATAGTLAGGLCGHGNIHGTGTLETPNTTPLVADIATT